jgi:hypothetical protein
MVKYPAYAAELNELLEADQEQWKSFWRDNYRVQDTPLFEKAFREVKRRQRIRSNRMLAILDAIIEPSLSNIGAEAAQAVSILALHDSLRALKRVLAAFTDLYAHNREDTYYQALPSMIDRVRILERKPQKFGTQWHWEVGQEPFLPTVEDFEHINEHRAEFGIEPFRWPRSLALPESEQPWLKRPLSELTMRDMTDDEYEKTARGCLD